MKKLVVMSVVALVSTSAIQSASAFDWGFYAGGGHHEFKTTESYNGLEHLKKKGDYGVVGVLAGHTFKTGIGNIRVEGDAGIYGAPNGDVSLVAEGGNFYYTNSDFSFKGFRLNANVLYQKEIAKDMFISPFVGIGYDLRKESTTYNAMENGQPIDGHYDDDYVYTFSRVGLKYEYSIFYASGALLVPFSDKIKQDKSYAGLGKPSISMGHKTGYELEAGLKWKFLKLYGKYQERKHDRFEDPVNGTQPKSKENWTEVGLAFVF